jgi:hypothetical protein
MLSADNGPNPKGFGRSKPAGYRVNFTSEKKKLLGDVLTVVRIARPSSLPGFQCGIDVTMHLFRLLVCPNLIVMSLSRLLRSSQLPDQPEERTGKAESGTFRVPLCFQPGGSYVPRYNCAMH